SFGDVLMLGGDKGVTLGAPMIAGASVAATLIETRKGEKVKIFKKIRRQGYRRTKGHRQPESVLRVTSIAGGGKSAKWDGEVDMTTRATINARARGIKDAADATPAAAAPAPKKTTPKVAKAAAASPEAASAESKSAKPKAAAKKAAPKAKSE
ncbi:MAG: 50S ribosomal protein L21, partial [Caulobacteraceae bacterium]